MKERKRICSSVSLLGIQSVADIERQSRLKWFRALGILSVEMRIIGYQPVDRQETIQSQIFCYPAKFCHDDNL